MNERIERKDIRPGGGGGVYSQKKIEWDCAARFPNPLPYLWPKSAIFPTLFMTWPKIWYAIYDHRSWHSCPKHSLWRAFVDGLINDNEKIASSKKTYPIQDKSAKTIPYLWPKWPKSILYLWPKRLKNHTFWGRTYLYSPYKGIPPHRGYTQQCNVAVRSDFTFTFFLESARALMTLPRDNNPLLMKTDSLNLSPTFPVRWALSEPARSTKWNLAYL